MSLARLIGGFVRRHWHAYVSSAFMLAGVAICTVLIPRKVGALVDGLAAQSLDQDALLLGLAQLLGLGVAIYVLRVGWRIRLYSAAYNLGVELRTRLYARLAAQGPGFYQRQRTGDLMALATNDIDAIEMAAGEAMLAGFDGTLTLVMVLGIMISFLRQWWPPQLRACRCRSSSSSSWLPWRAWPWRGRDWSSAPSAASA